MKKEVIFDDGKWRVKWFETSAGRRVLVESLLSGFSDWPIRCGDGRVLWDYPERVPAYVKRIVIRLFRGLAMLPEIKPVSKPVEMGGYCHD